MKVVSFSNPTPVEKMKSFPFKKKEWPDDDNKLKMKIANPAGGVAFSVQMRKLSGKEHPELFLLWLQDYRTKIWTNSNLNWDQKLDILLQIVVDDAITIVQRTLQKCEGIMADGLPIRTTRAGEGPAAAAIPIRATYQFKNWEIARRLDTMRTDAQWQTYVAPDGAHEQDKIKECIHALKFEIFGVDMSSSNSYYKLRRQIRGMKINFTDGVRKWAARIDDYQAYLPDMLWESGEKKGKEMMPFDETDLKEILDSAMTKVHLAQLLNVDWNHHEKPYAESIAKLESLEPQIIRHNEHEKRLSALEGGKPRKFDKNPRGNGTKKGNFDKKNDNNSFKKCDTCGKTHKGECWHSSDNDATKKPKDFKESLKRKRYKETLQIVNEIMESRANDSDDSDEDEWKKLTKNSDERAYVLGAASSDQNYYDSDISIDTSTTKEYLKRFRKATKGKGKKRKREK